MAEHGNLSYRGSVFASPSNKPAMLSVVCDIWHPESNAGGYLSLGVAENTLMHEELIEFMTRTFNIKSHCLTYGDGFSGSHELRDVVAKFMSEQFKPVNPVLKRHVAITSGVGPAIELGAFSLCDPGNGVLLGRPYYGNFPSDLASRAQVQVVGVSFGDLDPFSIEAVAAYEKALLDVQERAIAVKALLLCNPHNPLGRCYSRDALRAYMHLCQKYSLHLLSDEIYALTVWDNPNAPDAPGFTSMLSIDTTGLIDPSLVHVLWGMSKDFCSNGIRLGCVVTQNNDPFLQALETNSYFTCPSALSGRATSTILSNAPFVESFIATNRSRLASNYSLTACFLEQNSIVYYKGSNAGFFVWIDLFALLRSRIELSKSEQELWALHDELQETLMKHRVFLASGKTFGSDVPGWFRLVFAHESGYLKEGLRRIVKAVESFGRVLQNGQ